MILLKLLILLNLTVTLDAEPEPESTFFNDDLSKFNRVARFTSFPMLYFDEESVESLRYKALSTHAHITTEIQDAVIRIRHTPSLQPPGDTAEFGSKWNEVYGNNLPVLSLLYVLFPKPNLLEYVKSYMDKMAHYSSWQVKDFPNDEVPISHSLVGFATAYDFLYNDLDESRRDMYAKKIHEMTLHLYKASQTRGWGHLYLQSNQATNVMALLIGSLITEVHHQYAEEAIVWKTRALVLFERTMKLLKGIDDGSLNEGVGYVGYTMRSLSQYVYLVKRHFNFDHSNHAWLKKHFEYIYMTTLPGLHRTIGVADSPQAWFYGPESQLYFLDTYILRDGRATWLAEQIKKNKISIMKENRHDNQRYATLHTEYIFYDPTIKASPPKGYNATQLHHFSDWGVVTYRSGTITGPTTSFLSFKSSKLHGKYAFKIANTVNDETFPGWRALDPGHEHPDQNSFTVWFDGQPFVSDGLYGPKLPYLDNVLMFKEKSQGMTDSPSCMYPWVGQLGACGKWLSWKGEEERYMRGKILVALEKDSHVFIAGDAIGAYTKLLKLKHVFRSTLLLDKDILVMFDHVMLSEESRVTHVSTFFNNFKNTFRQLKHTASGLAGLTLSEDVRYQAFWSSIDGRSPQAKITSHNYTSSDRPQVTSNANVTFETADSRSSSVFIFAGPKVSVKEFGTWKQNRGEITIHLKTKRREYNIRIKLALHVSNDKPLCVVEDGTKNVTTEFYHKRAVSVDSRNASKTKSREITLESKGLFIALNIAAILWVRLKFGKRQRIWTSRKWSFMYILLGFIAVNLYVISFKGTIFVE